MRTLWIVATVLFCLVFQIFGSAKNNIINGMSLKTILHDCAEGDKKIIIRHLSSVPQPEILLSSNIVGYTIDKTQAPWVVAEVDLADVVDPVYQKFATPGIIPCAKSMVFQLKVSFYIVKNGTKTPLVSTTVSMCDEDPATGLLCMSLYDRMFRANVTTIKFFKAFKLTRKIGDFVKYLNELLSNNKAVYGRLELLYNKPIGDEPLPTKCTPGDWYPKNYTTSTILCLAGKSTATKRIAKISALDKEISNLQRTINASKGELYFNMTHPTICYNNGTLNSKGICECHGNFSGPGCRFPCPASLYANITTNDCASNPKRCVFDLNQYMHECVPYNNAPMVDSFHVNIVSMHKLEVLVTLSQFAGVFLNYGAIFQIRLNNLGKQVSMQVSLASEHETKFTVKHVCEDNLKTSCESSYKRSCTDDPGKQCGTKLTLPFFKNITVTFALLKFGYGDSDMAPNFLPMALRSEEVQTPEGPPGTPTELKITNITSNSAVILWQVPLDACNGIVTAYEIKCVRDCHGGPEQLRAVSSQNCLNNKQFRVTWLGKIKVGQEFKVKLKTSAGWGDYSDVLTNDPSSSLIIGLPVPAFASIMAAVIIILFIIIGMAITIGIKRYKRKFQNQCLNGLGTISTLQQGGSPVFNIVETNSNVGIDKAHRFNLTSGDATQFAPTPMGETVSGTLTSAPLYHDYYPSYERIAPQKEPVLDESQRSSSGSSRYQSDAWELK